MNLTFSNPLKGIKSCPQCNIASPLLSEIWMSPIAGASDKTAVNWGAYLCSSCKRVTLAEGLPFPTDLRGNPVSGHNDLAIRTLYPGPATVDDSLPLEARRYLRQALDTKFAPDASIVMAASAVDAMLKAKGYEKGNLYSRIDKAVSDHLLTEGMAEWAHKVRLEANAVRHADVVEQPPSVEDAAKVVDFAKALGDFLYVFAARVEEGLKDASEGDEESE